MSLDVRLALLKAGVQLLKYSDNQPRDEHGRWTSTGQLSLPLTGGRNPPKGEKYAMRFFHGTSEQALKGIIKDGLVPRGGKGADSWAIMHGYFVREMMSGSRSAGHVFMTQNKSEALDFAQLAAEATGTKPVLLEVHIPDRESWMMINDEATSDEAVRTRERIPPEWIRPHHYELPHDPSYSRALLSRIGKGLVTGPAVLWLVVPVDGQDEDTQVVKYDDSQPRDELGRWTESGTYVGTLPSTPTALGFMDTIGSPYNAGTDRPKGWMSLFSFESQAKQYPKDGPPGIGYYKGQVSPRKHVDCLLYRDKSGKVIGILNHYPFNFPHERKGAFTVMVDPAHQKQGIATALVREAAKRWNVDLGSQNLTPAGLKLANSLLDPSVRVNKYSDSQPSATGNNGRFDPRSPNITKAFDPEQPRDERGRWSSGGSTGSTNDQPANPLADAQRALKDFVRVAGKSPSNAIEHWNVAHLVNNEDASKISRRSGRCHEFSARKVMLQPLIDGEGQFTQVIGVAHSSPDTYIWHSLVKDKATGNLWEPISDRWYTPNVANQVFGFQPVAELSHAQVVSLAQEHRIYPDQTLVKPRNWNKSYLKAGDFDVMVLKYSEDQPRDEMGRWTSGGGGSGPVKTVTGYKQFQTRSSQPGKLFPLFIDSKTPVPVGEWIPAGNHPTPGFAARPGWHAGALPYTPQLRTTGKDGNPSHIQEGRVWAQVSLPADVDWQSVADSRPSKDIKDQVPTGGHYRWNRPGSQGGTWVIGGALRVDRILSDNEVADILRSANLHEHVQAETWPRRVHITKYSEDQPRDENGRWTDGGSSNGSNPQTKTDNFKAWFGNSKGTHDDGSPKVFYHATPVDIKEFIPGGVERWNNGRLDPNGELASGPAVWFTDNKEFQPAAHNTAGRRDQFRQGTNVMPVYLKMERPLLIDDELASAWARKAYDGGDSFPLLLTQKTVDMLKEDGYDSIIYKPSAWRSGAQGHDEYIVFEPTQIKSAIGNNGQFDPHNPNITKELGMDSPIGKFAPDQPRDERGRWVDENGNELRQPSSPGAGTAAAWADRTPPTKDNYPDWKVRDWQPTVGRVAELFDYMNSKGPVLDPRKEEDFRQGVHRLANDLREQMKQVKSGLNWYEEDVHKAFEETTKIFPSLKDPQQKQLFSLIAAIMSPSLFPHDNWNVACQAYDHYLKTGIIPGRNPENGSLWMGGPVSEAKESSLNMLNAMIHDKSLGVSGTLAWALSAHPGYELRDYRQRYGGMGANTTLKEYFAGAEAFGPKVGPFMQNINGIHEVTIDKWATRTFNRIFGGAGGASTTDPKTGKIIPVDAPRNDSERDIAKRLFTEAANEVGIKNYQAQSVEWFFEQRLYRSFGADSPSYGFSDGVQRYRDHLQSRNPSTAGSGGSPSDAGRPKGTGRRGRVGKAYEPRMNNGLTHVRIHLMKARLGALALAIQKFRDDQPRDDRGRWTSDSGHVAQPEARMLSSHMSSQGGLTYSMIGHEYKGKGYVVSIYPERSTAIKAEQLKVSDITSYVDKHWDALSQSGNYLGGWHNKDDGLIYLDVSRIVDSEDEAVRLAREHDQIAVWSLHDSKEITVNRNATSGGASHVGKATRKPGQWPGAGHQGAGIDFRADGGAQAHRSGGLGDQGLLVSQVSTERARLSALAAIAKLKKFRADQPRDENGRWTDGAGSGGGMNAEQSFMSSLPKSFNVAPTNSWAPPQMLSAAQASIQRFSGSLQPPRQLTPEERSQGAEKLAPFYEKAKEAKGVFDKVVSMVAERTQAEGVRLAPLKRMERAVEKMVLEEDGKPENIKDILRATIVVDHPGRIQEVLNALRDSFNVVRTKNRVGLDMKVTEGGYSSTRRHDIGGYGDVLMNVRMKNGAIAEIQVATPEMISAKEHEGHKLYEIARNFPEGHPVRAQVLRASEGLYNAAYVHSMSRMLR